MIVRFFRAHAVPLAITALALAVRLVWNLWIHPPGRYLYSDMEGIIFDARLLAEKPWEPVPPVTIQGPGARVLFALTMWITSPDNLTFGAVVLAFMGALIAPLTYSLCGELHAGPQWREQARARRAAAIAGIVAALYYPLISFGGYFLSEAPYAVMLTAAALFTLRVADGGRARDAWLLGASVGLAFWFRPQIIVVVPLLLAFMAWRRRAFPLVRAGHAVRAGAGIALALCLSSLFVHHHTGAWSLTPKGRALNRVFARCHNVEINGGGLFYGPEVFSWLHRRTLKFPDGFFQLDPAREIAIAAKDPLWIEEPLDAIADDCVARTGIVRQLRYAGTHVVLLWTDTAWPDSGRPEWRVLMRWSNRVQFALFFPPMIVAMFRGLGERDARRGLVALYLWSMIVVAMLYFGSARIRTVHDALVIALAIDSYARLVAWIRGRSRVLGLATNKHSVS